MSSPPLACCAQPFGYGPAAKLVPLARGLRARGVPLVFVGTGIAHELAARSAVFDEVHEVAPDTPAARAVLAGSRAVLSVMDRDFAALASALGVPLFVVDSLGWMRDEVPPAFRAAARYWSFGFDESVPAGAIEVGPLIAPEAAPPAAKRSGLVVQLGGAASPFGELTDDPAYLAFVMRGLLEVAFPAGLGSRILLAGQRCAKYLQEHDFGSGFECRSVAHERSVELLRSAACVLTAPGLTATLECFQSGTPTLFLPPQNYSQWCVLRTLREAGAAAGFHWSDVELGARPDELPEPERTPFVREVIRRHASTAAARSAFRAALEAGLAVRAELARGQRAFFARLGPNGVTQVVAELAALV